MPFSFAEFWSSSKKSPDENTGHKLTPQQQSHQLEIENSLLVLIAEVLRCEKKIGSKAEKLILDFLEKQFGKKRHAQRLQTIQSHIDSGTEPFTKIAAKQLVLLTTYDSRQRVAAFLFEVAAADDFATDKQKRCIKRIAQYMGITDFDFKNIQQRFFKTNNPYFVLGLEEGVPIEEVKRAYRKLVIQHHPDKRQEKDTSEKFRQIRHAYELIFSGYK